MKSWRAVTYLFRPQYKRLGIQMLTTIRSKMSEVEVINIFKPYSERKKERDRETETERDRQTDRDRETERETETERRESPAFLFSVGVWSHLAHSWPGLNYMCEAKKHWEKDKYIITTFPLQRHLAF